MDQRTLDLSTREGILGYVEGMLLPDIRAAFALKGTLQPFGVAFGTVQNGTKLPRPQTMTVGAMGMGLRNTKRSLRNLARNSGAKGCVLAYLTTCPVKGSTTGREAEIVLVQLEHCEHGDIVWTAPVSKGALGDFTVATPVADATLTINPSRFLPQRYMH